MMEQAKREAAERLRREELRRAEEEARRIQEEKDREEAARRKALEAEERERIKKQEEERKKIKAEELRKREETRKAEREHLKERFKNLKDGEVMLTGHVTAQGGNSIMWRRRYFQLKGDSLALFKNEQDLSKTVDKIDLSNKIKSISDDAEVMIPHSFKLNFKDFDEEPYLFYCDEAEDKDLLIVGIQLAARL
ncbi:hypothetical protein BT69DRAFT_482942 [Atractiella rhizophila]|nr:hypothetical protein BT69DRAFT_482942 [Atractiella rhizophila]